MRFSCVVALLLCSLTSRADQISIATFNVESGSDTQSFRVAEIIRAAGAVDIWAFQEVAGAADAKSFTVAAAAAAKPKSYRWVMSESGRNDQPHREHDHLVIAYNSSDFRQLETVELHAIRSVPGDDRLGEPDWRLRGALLLRLRHNETGAEFYVGTVHLKCCRVGRDIRSQQSSLLRDWVDAQDVPVVLAGDFNIPVAPDAAEGNAGSDAFGILTETMTWLRPDNPVKTICNPTSDAMLDHAFLKPGARITRAEATILRADPGFCELDEQGYPDHRPVLVRIEIDD